MPNFMRVCRTPGVELPPRPIGMDLARPETAGASRLRSHTRSTGTASEGDNMPLLRQHIYLCCCSGRCHAAAGCPALLFGTLSCGSRLPCAAVRDAVMRQQAALRRPPWLPLRSGRASRRALASRGRPPSSLVSCGSLAAVGASRRCLPWSLVPLFSPGTTTPPCGSLVRSSLVRAPPRHSRPRRGRTGRRQLTASAPVTGGKPFPR
jgi:hypothetical protein